MKRNKKIAGKSERSKSLITMMLHNSKRTVTIVGGAYISKLVQLT